MTDLHLLDATAALGLFRAKELSPVELMRAVIERHEHVGAPINAYTETMFDEALDAARDAEARYQQGVERPGLLGLPVATKEKHMLAGRSLSQGLTFRRDDVSDVTHPVVERIRRAGGIVHARTTSPEYSCATVTHSPLWGVTRNPWNLDYSPGGSSGGSGAALAAGFTPLATASDIAGSTRVPAAFTGTVGYKAPYGRIPGVRPLSADPYRGDGPMARTIADAALLANVMLGRDPDDHSSIWPDITIPVRADVADLRIALCMRLGDYRVTTEVEQHTYAVARALADAGAVVEDVELPWSSRAIAETAFTHFGHILGPAMEDETAGHEAELAEYTRRFIADARAAAERNRFVDGLRAETRLQSELATAMRGFDALICPTSCTPALAADGDYLDGIDIDGVHLEHYWESHLTLPFNIANRCPVLAVPSGVASTGVPTGVQIVGHPYDDASVFRVGAALEQFRPRGNNHPDIESLR
ncbi:amidase [Solicola gregarius]|uniref:Amidase n=1 Tax=Solicola gregarius TaxID=2908642 RepID=A0AA46YK51_9ACTN|nr:amidase [Solicola gregarius]UYM04136.1 amidase [Solicola gregarius]